MPSISSGVTLPYTSSLTVRTGASPQHPRQRKFQIVGALPALDLQRVAQLFVHVSRTFYIAGRAQADADFILPLRIQRKLRVKRCDAVNFRKRYPQFVRDDLLNGFGKIAVNLLRLLQRRDHQPFAAVLDFDLRQGRAELFFLFLRTVERNVDFLSQ